MPMDLPPPAIVCAAPQPDASAEAALARARAARFLGHTEAARCAAEAAVRLAPQDADAWLELGLISSALGNDRAARDAFQRALALAPNYDDAKLGLARLAYRAGDLTEARAWLARVDAARRGDPEVESLRAALNERPRAAWRWDGLASYSSLSNGLAPWREFSIYATRRSGQRSFGAGLEYVRRFGLTDLYGEGRFYQADAHGGVWGLALGAAPDAVFKPEAAARFEYTSPEDRPWVFGGALSFARYATGGVNSLTLSAERNLGAGWRASARTIGVRDETGAFRTGYGLGATSRLADETEFSLIWTDAPESSAGATIDVQSVSLGVGFDLSPSLRLRIGALKEERQAFDRTEVSVAFVRTF
jgi:YaiO family outer membrane protein